jgi:signal transduction histidine kinase/CHASE3 domain sensor protein
VKYTQNRTIVAVGFWLAVAILVGIAVATHQSTVRLLATSDRVERVRVVTESLQRVSYGLQEAEQRARALIRNDDITQERARLRAAGQVNQALDRLRKITTGQPPQYQDIEALTLLAADRLLLLEQAIQIRNREGLNAALQFLDSDRSRALNDQIRASLDKLMDDERKALLKRDDELKAKAQVSVALFVLGCFLSLVIFLAVFLYLNIQIAARRLAERALAREKQLLEQQYRRQAALAEIELAINQPHELQTVLDRIAQAITELMPAAGASVILWDAAAEEFVVSSTTVPGQTVGAGKERVRRTGGATRWIVDHQEVLVVPDIREDPFGANPMLHEYGLQSYIGVPLLLEGEALGVVYALDNQPRQYRDDEIELLQALATRAALAVSKVRLYDKLKDINRLLENHVRERTSDLIQTNERLAAEADERRRAEQALQELSGRLLQLQDQERRHIARELHDVTAQNLGAIALNLARLEKFLSRADHKTLDVLNESILLAEECLREIRTLSYVLHPPMLDEYGLPRALEWYLEGFGKRSGVQVELHADPDIGRLPAATEMALFRIVQESLTNIRRHSGSHHAAIQLTRANGAVTLEIMDDGHGFREPLAAGKPPSLTHLGVGITGMRERLRQLGGQLDIESTPRGTRVRATVPIREGEAPAEPLAGTADGSVVAAPSLNNGDYP